MTQSEAGHVTYSRGGQAESRHEIHVAVVDANGNLKAHCGNADLTTFPRSSSKPVQALPLAEAMPDLPQDELAVACSSHAGTPEHLAVVQRLLARSGSSVADLRCGTHPPFDAHTAASLIQSQQPPTPLHHNCSGKHAGMLLACVRLGLPREGYTHPAHPLQVQIRALHATLADVPLEAIHAGVDGCSVPAFALPLQGTARIFARLAAPSGPHAQALARIAQAMQAHPFLVAGPGRLDTTLMPLVPGLTAKMGAEAFYGMGLQETPYGPLGVAFKVMDGGERARSPMALAVLKALGVPLTEAVWALAPSELRNWAGQEVGIIHTHLPLVWS